MARTRLAAPKTYESKCMKCKRFQEYGQPGTNKCPNDGRTMVRQTDAAWNVSSLAAFMFALDRVSVASTINLGSRTLRDLAGNKASVALPLPGSLPLIVV